MRLPYALAIISASLTLTACISLPPPLMGEVSPLIPRDAKTTDVGHAVRWGGVIVEVEPGAERTCLTLLAKPLRGDGRPDPGDTSLGRFIACRAGFYDPAVFVPNRELTVRGRIAGLIEKPVGEFRYGYPQLDADVLYLWPERRNVDVVVIDRPGFW